MGTTKHFGIIGAGVLGAAVAREVSQKFPKAHVTVVDKASTVAAHQTGHNSGVVHAGLYYEPGSLKARLCRRGVDLMCQYAVDGELPFDECGKLVVALETHEEPRLKNIYNRALANGVPDVELVGPDGIREIEPNAVGRMALHSPHTAIIDYSAVARHLIQDVVDTGGDVLLGAEVTEILNGHRSCSVVVRRDDGEEKYTFDHLIICAGLQSDRMALLAGGSRYPRIVPFFGQYSMLGAAHRNILRGLVYPVPDPTYPFLGVHLTKRVDGEMLVGPNAFLSLGRENYSGWQIGLKDSLAVASEPGFWKFASRNLKAAGRELEAVVSRRKFIGGAAKYVPDLVGAESTPLTRGIRAQAMDRKGHLVDDFVIERVGASTIVRNAPSPGATSSLAIAEYLVETTIEIV
ncbi:L-2-hydroxyglutarate oxidase [Brevibacterium sp. UCMA 11754]|uniref:L-2-hydroxyglutarate oxidase n=1 Tax=Brevibacterium sp. UCMA 11754 TaxID=2749198 RepID=UPI001F2D0090|nr:L-2-hydroxyglutarate oxidase [Brevibacterium sp. UCMA 11754]MCF2571120.1 L-2-hydroxyglutarate oxidase [Brevibacterium sp. UCMA 11754]